MFLQISFGTLKNPNLGAQKLDQHSPHHPKDRAVQLLIGLLMDDACRLTAAGALRSQLKLTS